VLTIKHLKLVKHTKGLTIKKQIYRGERKSKALGVTQREAEILG
jgi:hypothetical protein